MIRNVAEGLFRGPRLMEPEYIELRCLGGRNILTLESSEDAIAKELVLCDKYNIKLFHERMSEILPTSIGRLRMLAALTNKLKEMGGVYVHCRRGVDRTGQVIAAWQIIYGGKTFEEAYQEMVSFGHPELYNLLGWKYVLSMVK